MIKTVLLCIALGAASSATYAQAVDAAKETGKAMAEGTKEGADNAKASMHSGPEKAMDKTKASMHKAKAHYHRHRAKADVKAATP